MSARRTLRVLHFNDVYNVGEQAAEPVGGAARFGGLLHSLQDKAEAEPTLTLFSGDAFFPSLESTVSMGDHMRAVLNEMRIDAAVYGNHEFDSGVPVLEGLTERCNFPWIITNLVDTATGKSAVRGSVSHVIKELDGLRIGIIGIIEKDWLDTLAAMPESYQYQHYIDATNKATRELKDPAGAACDLVICLTHMRLNHNIKISECCPEVDLILAGHDHFYYIGSGIEKIVEGADVELGTDYVGYQDDRDMMATWKAERASLAPGSRGNRIIISGTDFRDMSEIMLELDESAAAGTEISRVVVKRHRVTTQAPEDPATKAIVDAIESQLSEALDKDIGYSTSALDARSSVCRMQESSLGNFTSDILRHYYAESTGAQIALCCGGTIRSDKTFPAGTVRLREIAELFPFTDPNVVIKMTGEQIRLAVENGVSKWPQQEGRFLHVSGLRYEFDPAREPGSRVTSIVVTGEAKATARCTRTRAANTPAMSRSESMNLLPAMNDSGMSPTRLHHSDSTTMIDAHFENDDDDDEADEPLDMNATYIVATRHYMYEGYDGYESMKGCEAVVDEKCSITVAEMFHRYFKGLAASWALLDRLNDPSKQSVSEESEGDLEGLNDSIGGGVWRRMLLEHAYRGRGQTMPSDAAPISKHAPVDVSAAMPAATIPANVPTGLPVIVPFTDGRVKNVGAGDLQNVANGSRFNTALTVVVE